MYVFFKCNYLVTDLGHYKSMKPQPLSWLLQWQHIHTANLILFRPLCSHILQTIYFFTDAKGVHSFNFWKCVGHRARVVNVSHFCPNQLYTQTHRSYIFYFLINHWFWNGIETITVARSTAEVQEREETKPLVPFFHSLESADICKNQTVHVRMIVTKHFALQNFQHRLMTYS